MLRIPQMVINKSNHICTKLVWKNSVAQKVLIRWSSTEIPPEINEKGQENVVEGVGNSQDELIEKLQAEIKDLKNQVLRSYAEEENVRRIAKRDVENAKAYANTSFAKSMLDVADNLERAIATVPGDKIVGNPDLKVLLEGIQMTEKGLQTAFAKFSVKKFGTVGDAFDPSLHEALFRYPDANKPPNTIGQVLKNGYKLNDRVIRAAEVGTIAGTD